jgi:hypothetical protein
LLFASAKENRTMAMANAIRFLKDIGGHAELRDELYRCEGMEALQTRLAQAGYAFSGGEFEEAVDVAHCACQTHEEADELMNRVHWMRMLYANC